jgi:alpha-N-acetylglucosaminidase
VTTWGPSGSLVNDYAAKQWNGLMKDYYYNRWRIFITQMVDQLMRGKTSREEIDWKRIER